MKILNPLIYVLSIKYKNAFLPNQSSISELDGELSKIYTSNINHNNYMIGLIVKDKKLVENHIYKNDAGNQTLQHSNVIKNNLLYDETDIINGLD